MERLESKNKLLSIGAVCSLGALGLAGCGAGSYEISADKPMTVLSEAHSKHFVTSQEAGGYQHYEDVYSFTVEQCDRSDLAIADEDGCVTLSLNVDESIYKKFDAGDRISFSSERSGYPIDKQ